MSKLPSTAVQLDANLKALFLSEVVQGIPKTVSESY